ncbi:unnamed protein product [Heterobilharzia americana]|nr:unnamed protein product [Heterobilharzia americana]
MDNTTITFPGTIHFETDQFFYADDSWVLTIDIEPYRDSLPNANLNNGDNQNLCADVELCLTKQIPHKNNCTYQEIEKPLGTNWIHLTCKAYLPGDCNTGLMEFLIGSHGWPMKAHCCKFDEKTKHDLKHEQTDQGRVDNTKCDSSKYSVKAKLHSSVSAFLLSSVSSNFTFTLEMKLYERLTVVNFPLNSCENTNFSDSCSITDPFQLQWRLFMCTSSRLIRLGLIREQKKHVIDHESQYMTSNKWSPRRHAKHQHSEHFSIPSVYMDLVGCKLRIHGYQSDASHPNTIEPVGKEILQLMFTKSDVYEEPMPYERRQHNHTKVAQNNLNVFLIDYLSHNVLKSDALELWRDLCNNGIFDVSIKDSERLYRKANQISIGQIAMEITRQELTDTNMGLFNPKTGTIIIEIHWIYRHQVYIDTLYQTDEIGARQYQQMRSELMRITKERDELERQLMAFQLGFVQIDSHSLGPKSMLPLESVTGNVGQPRRPPSKSNEDWYDSKRHVEKVEAQLFSHRMDNVSSVGYISRSTKPHVISSSSPSYYTSSRSNTSKPSDLSLTSLLEVSNRRSSFDYEFSDEQLPGTSNSIHRPCSSQLLSSSTGLSEKRKQFLGSKSNWKTCEAPKYRSDFDYSQVCGYRYSMQKSRSDRESGQNYMVGNSSPCSISDSSTSRAFTSRSEHEFSFASK